jgi:L-threonylcarbamoyladenylate synthase
MNTPSIPDQARVPGRTIAAAIAALRTGAVIACPTEAVWGLSCDPFNEHAVDRVLALKGRSRQAGLILIAASLDQIETLMGELPRARKDSVLATWPGPVTWICPAGKSVPPWVRGEHDSVALRVTAHPIASALCEAFGGPLVSTSANPTGLAPASSEVETRALFPNGIEVLIPGDTGDATGPTQIRHALTGKLLRASP